MIRIDFNRRTGSASCDGVQTRGAAMSDEAHFDLVRVLVNLNYPDDRVGFFDEFGVYSLSHPSLFGCARYYRPSQDEKAMQVAAAALAAAKQQKARKGMADTEAQAVRKDSLTTEQRAEG